MKKLKSLKLSTVATLLKACLFGLLITLVGIIILAVILKFADLSSVVVNCINDAIKVLSLFAVVLIIKKVDGQNLLLKSVFAGLIYAVLAFVVFSTLSGSFVFNMSVVYDLLFAVVSAVVVAVVVNLTSKKVGV